MSARYERASVIVTSNKPFGRWGEVFGDATVAAAMVDRWCITPRRQPQGRQLPAEGPRPREGAYRRRCVTIDLAGEVKFYPVPGGQISGGVDRKPIPSVQPTAATGRAASS